jgi:hypothetical protein
LDLVEDERDAPLVRQRAQLAQEPGVEHAYAALPLHRLDDQRGGGLHVQSGRDVVEVALDDRHAWCEWTERQPVSRPVRCRKRREEPSVERATERYDLMLRSTTDRACPPPRELERAFVRFSAGVAEEDLRRERPSDESRGKLTPWRARIEVRDVHESVDRAVHRSLQPRVGVAERVHSNSAHEVEVAPPGGVVQVDATAVGELDRRALVGAKDRVRTRL